MEAIKPRQIINYDAGIVLIDLHQLNVKITSDNTNQRHRGATSCQRRTEPAEQQPATSAFLTKWLNKLTSLLRAKRGQEFLVQVVEACRRRLTSEKRAYTSIKSDEEWTSRVLPSEQDDIVNSLNYEALRGGAVLLTFLTVTDCVWLCHRLNSLND